MHAFRPRYAAWMLAFAFLLSGCETAPPVRQGEVRVKERDVDVRVVFGEQDRRVIREYYAVRVRHLPPGLAKKGKVPPGHAKKLARHAPLPAEVRWSPLPEDLDRRLSRLPEGYVRVVVGTDVAILNTRTRVVLDVIEDVAY